MFTFADSSMSMGTAHSAGFWWVAVIVGVLGIIAFWRVFQKAGQSGWKAIIPIYNLYILLKIVGRPGWWIILYFIPVVNIITQIVVAMDSAKAFGKGKVFGFFGLWLFSVIGYLILGFGNAQYKGVAQK